jgi:acetyltransferase-like isoleucine patch superfamily enzyme
VRAAAHIASGARLADDVRVGPFSVVHDDVVLERGVVVESHCVLGHPTPLSDEPLVIGTGGHVRSHSVFYRGSTFGPGLETGHQVTVREQTAAGENLRLGTGCDVQGDVTFGDFCRLHSGVFVPKGCRLGNFVWIFPYAVLTNDPTPPSDVESGVEVDDEAVVGAGAVLCPGVRIGAGAVVAAGSVVTRSVPPGQLVGGSPARCIKAAEEVLLRDGSGAAAYPWRRHFARGLPPF